MAWAAIGAITAVVGTGASLLGSAKSTEAGKGQAAAQAELSREEKRAAGVSLAKLPGLKESKEKVAKADYGFKLEGLASQSGIAKEDIVKQTEQGLKKSGMSFSGTVTSKRSDALKRIGGAFKRGGEGILGELGKTLSGIEEWMGGETARLQGIMKRADIQIRNLSGQANDDSWYPGKYLSKLFSDRKLKKDIKLVGTLENSINVYEFEYIWGGERTVGVMADEVEKLYPEAVTTHPNGYQSVDYSLIL